MRLPLTRKTPIQRRTETIRIIILIVTPISYLAFSIPSLIIYLLFVVFIVLLQYEYRTREKKLVGELVLENNNIELLFNDQSHKIVLNTLEDVAITTLTYRRRFASFRSIIPEGRRANEIVFMPKDRKNKFHFTISSREEYTAVCRYFRTIAPEHPGIAFSFGLSPYSR